MIIQLISAVVILGIAILFLNPGHLSMPDNMNSMLAVAMIIAFLAFAGMVLKEKSTDEREQMHALSAGRTSYLVGVTILIVAVIIQALSHNIDPWLVIALCAMVFTKLISRIYSGIRK